MILYFTSHKWGKLRNQSEKWRILEFCLKMLWNISVLADMLKFVDWVPLSWVLKEPLFMTQCWFAALGIYFQSQNSAIDGASCFSTLILQDYLQVLEIFLLIPDFALRNLELTRKLPTPASYIYVVPATGYMLQPSLRHPTREATWPNPNTLGQDRPSLSNQSCPFWIHVFAINPVNCEYRMSIFHCI